MTPPSLFLVLIALAFAVGAWCGERFGKRRGWGKGQTMAVSFLIGSLAALAVAHFEPDGPQRDLPTVFQNPHPMVGDHG